ncbi:MULTISPECIES: GlsB/YeaQ/YmgE family stress response membrane protein [Kordiimonas]|jgi:uncharacterized membrane protein YeaQ/YmgE (transglycosylase-associated protein family)|uniref:GlsB/YeaQ/YmgE family stress response membrane protein n=1 Tax=Kordiimonas TaxID=288021 RepID=UPI00257F907E|nr:GlsB/YeaQ/YmgE family stress response membrane protein [Kordiimonas sp. UBA4487]
MSLIIWTLLGVGLGLIASKLVSTTGEGTVVDILIGGIGALTAGWLFDFFGGITITGFNSDGVYSAVAAIIGAIVCLVAYHMFFRQQMR